MDQLSIFDSDLKNDDPIYQELKKLKINEFKTLTLLSMKVKVSFHHIFGRKLPIYELETEDTHELVYDVDQLYKRLIDLAEKEG